MKHFILLQVFLFSLILSNSLFSQGLFGKIKDKVQQRVDNNENQAIDKTLDKADPTKTNNTNNNTASNTNTTNTTNTTTKTPETLSVTAYQNYDFRAGDKIIFADNFATDNDGEFASHWDLVAGQAVVNKVTGFSSFLLTDGNYVRVKPYMKTEKYLTDNFSVEYDTYMTPGAYGLIIFMNSAEGDMNVHVTADAATWTYSNTKSFSGSFPSAIQNQNYLNKWHHIAIAYKNDQLKVYVDQYRILVVPHCNFKPEYVECAGIGDQNNPIIFKDFKVADGASMNMLDAILTDGKFITHGINFDVNSAKLKPESMGVISDIVKFMQAHTDLKLEIDGHTDSDGSDATNLTLSQQRADAVRAAIIQAGIDSSRLTTKGFGESKPIASNETPEGKASNRRVEFIKK